MAAASRNNLATRCSLHFIETLLLQRVFGDSSECATATQENLSSGSLETTVEEIARCVISGQPIFVQQKIVNVVGKNELFDLDAFLAEARDEIDGLGEINVAVVVAVNEQDGRLPGIHSGHRRR